jgi:endonuclease YncB( thermonuclease family)
MIKETLVLAALAIAQPTVVDGDTVKIAGVRIRLTDFDAPERYHPKCPREYARAQAAKLELEQLVPQLKLELVPCATANYGRLCARGTIDDGTLLAEHMIRKNLGAPYVCHPGWCPRKRDWCASTE